MAGIGIELNRVFHRKGVLNTLRGIGYSTVITIAPMLLVIGNILLMYAALDYESIDIAKRELLASGILYVFIFAQLTSTLFNPVISRYVSDRLFDEDLGEILPCYYTGLALNVALSMLVAVPFCLVLLTSGVLAAEYVLVTLLMYLALIFVFYNMIFLSATKNYKQISLCFLAGMLLSLGLACLLSYVCGMEKTAAMQLSMAVGLLLTATGEYAILLGTFPRGGKNYKGLLRYFLKHWRLSLAGAMYTLGLFAHNFVFWNTPLRMVVAGTYISAPSYDVAACLAMFTSISANVIFIVQVETKFNERYKQYVSAVIGNVLSEIDNACVRMFRSLMREITRIVQMQFVISAVLYLIVYLVMPRMNLSGLVMEIYPALAAGYFIVFMMYCLVVFLYYFDDQRGALLTCGVFLIATVAGAIAATRLPDNFYGTGLCFGALCGWTAGYFRIRYMERHMDAHMFCRGALVPTVRGKRPSGCIYQAKRG